MHRLLVSIGVAATLAGTGVCARDSGSAAVMTSIRAFTDSVNHGDMAAALGYFTANPSIIEDLAPYRFTGPQAGTSWINAMGANAQAHGFTGIDMKLSSATRIEVTADRAYAIVPGVLTFTMKDGGTKRAAGTLTFALQQVDRAWKIDAMTWTGVPPK